MGPHNTTPADAQHLAEPMALLPLYFIFPFILAGLIILLPRSFDINEPPKLSETIPYVSNTWQYVNNMTMFMERTLYAIPNFSIALLQKFADKVTVRCFQKPASSNFALLGERHIWLPDRM